MLDRNGDMMDSGRLDGVSWRAIPVPCLFASRDWIVSLRCALILSVSGTSVSNPVPSNDTPRLPTRSIIVQRLAPPQDLFDTTTAPHVAPTGPTMPHGPESRHHHSSTLCRPDWPHDDTWTRRFRVRVKNHKKRERIRVRVRVQKVPFGYRTLGTLKLCKYISIEPNCSKRVEGSPIYPLSLRYP